MAAIAGRVEKALESVREPITVAIMGCMVNGPGESKEADIGVACGQGVGVLFRGGRLLRRVPEADIIPALLDEVRALLEERKTP